MPWKKVPGVAMYAGADWSNLILEVRGTTVAEARRTALANPDITFFFYCTGPMYLGPENGNPAREFQSGDAVFFSGKPWYGSAPQCDSYEKDEMAVVYISPASPDQLRQIACYQMPDGSPCVDVVSLFAGNYASGQAPYLRANNNNPPTQQPLNDNILQVLDDGSVGYLQQQGITVLLAVTNGWSPVGWSEFSSEQDAASFAGYLRQDIVHKYGLDGIDIDDEYSTGTPDAASLAMVTTIMKQLMPDKLITKALWSDYPDFGPKWKGRTLADNLTYGWEMSYYGGGPEDRLAPYLKLGLNRNQLVLGFSAEDRFKWGWPTIGSTAAQVAAQGYAGGMMYDYQNQPASIGLMQTMTDAMSGAGSWALNPFCTGK